MTRRVGCLLALAAWGAPMFAQSDEKPAKDVVVWALDDTDKVHPVSGNLQSEGAEVYNGARPSQGEYRTRNSVWDAATQTVKLSAGRNEFVSFQVVLEKGREDVHKIFVNATDLLGARERIGADRNIRLFKQLYVPIHGSWYPDALLPFEIAGATPFDLARQERRRAGAARAGGVGGYLRAARPAAGHLYRQIIVVQRNTNKQAILKVELQVAGFTLPDKLGLDVDLMNYGFLNIERGWPDLVQDGPRHRAIEREFFRMAHAHRTTFAIVPYNHDGSIPKGQKPELAGIGDGVRVAGLEFLGRALRAVPFGRRLRGPAARRRAGGALLPAL